MLFSLGYVAIGRRRAFLHAIATCPGRNVCRSVGDSCRALRKPARAQYFAPSFRNWHGCCFDALKRLDSQSRKVPLDDSSWIRAADQAATHPDAEVAAVRETASALGAGMC